MTITDALSGLLNRYVEMVNSGDCGFWNPEKDAEVIAARAALAAAQARAPALLEPNCSRWPSCGCKQICRQRTIWAPAGAPSEEEISRALEDYVPGAADHQGAVAAMMALLRRVKE